MKIIYFGSSHFSEIVLSYLVKIKRRPALVVSTPDKPQGRGLKMAPTPVKAFSLNAGLEVFSPASLSDPSVERRLREFNPDLFLVASYGKIIPAQILSIPAIMPIALHPSLLPHYRGAAPINWVLINGEKETGITIFKVVLPLDSGEVIFQTTMPVSDDDTIVTLSHKLALQGARDTESVLSLIEKGDYALMPQDEREASYAPKLTKSDGKISWQKDARAIRNCVRGMQGWPQAYTACGNLLISLIELEVLDDVACQSPGEIVGVSRKGIDVAAGRGIVRIRRLKPAGKKEMTAAAFICGHRLKAGDMLR